MDSRLGCPGHHSEHTHAGVAHHGDVSALCQVIDFTHVGSIKDPWAGIGIHSVCDVLGREHGMQVVTNGPGPGQMSHLHPLHPRTYDAMGACDAIITCPWTVWADTALSMAMLYARMVVCMLVPSSYVRSMHGPRATLVDQLREAGRLVVLDHLAPDVNGYRNLWVVVFMDRNTTTLLMGPNMPR